VQLTTKPISSFSYSMYRDVFNRTAELYKDWG